jgi:hypothetical protein
LDRNQNRKETYYKIEIAGEEFEWAIYPDFAGISLLGEHLIGLAACLATASPI